MKINDKATFHGTNHLFDRMEERIKFFENNKEALTFCRSALINREPSYTIYDGSKITKVISDDLVFILDNTDPWNITVITVYTNEEFINMV